MHFAHVIQIRLAELRSANRLGVFWILLEHSSTTTFVGNWRRTVKIVAYRRDLNPCYRRESGRSAMPCKERLGTPRCKLWLYRPCTASFSVGSVKRLGDLAILKTKRTDDLEPSWQDEKDWLCI